MAPTASLTFSLACSRLVVMAATSRNARCNNCVPLISSSFKRSNAKLTAGTVNKSEKQKQRKGFEKLVHCFFFIFFLLFSKDKNLKTLSQVKKEEKNNAQFIKHIQFQHDSF